MSIENDTLIKHGQKYIEHNYTWHFSLEGLINTFGCTKTNISEILSRYIIVEESEIIGDEPTKYVARQGLPLFGKYCTEKKEFEEFVQKINDEIIGMTDDLILVEDFKRKRKSILRRIIDCFR